jgi:hypothetical protein
VFVPFESDDRSGGFQARPFVASSFTTDVDASGGQVHVAWPESGAGTVLMANSTRIYARTQVP